MQRILVTFLALAMPLAVHSQVSSYRGHGFAFFSFDASQNSAADRLAVGAGGEGFVFRGLAVGADLAYLFPREAPGAGIGLLSANPAYHFVNRDKPGKWVPFVTAGYGLAFRSDSINLFNYGGGITYWFASRAGLRVEVRDNRNSDSSLFLIRVGVSFR
jgi:hypothetical protein